MIYAVGDSDGKWVILRGWKGCEAGQGNVLEDGVDEKDVQNKIKEAEIILERERGKFERESHGWGEKAIPV